MATTNTATSTPTATTSSTVLDKTLAAASNTITVPKLNDDNWRTWSRIMKEVLTGRGLWPLVKDGTLAQPNDDAWIRANSVAMSILLTAMDADQLPDLGNTDVAHEAWANLSSARASKSAQAQLNNLTGLFSLTYTGGSVTKFAHHLHQLFLVVNEAGSNLSELVGIGLLIQKLPENFSALIRQCTVVNSAITIKEAISKIAMEEQRLIYADITEKHQPIAMSNYASPSFNRDCKPQCDHSRHSGGARACWQLHPELRQKNRVTSRPAFNNLAWAC
jgi:hypothetical protein